MALVAAAAERLAAAVVRPAEVAPPGVARLIALAEGCLAPGVRYELILLTSAAPGLGDAALARRTEWRTAWVRVLADQCREAIERDELAQDCDVDQAAFEMNTYLLGVLHGAELDDTQATTRARRAIEALNSAGTSAASTPRTRP